MTLDENGHGEETLRGSFSWSIRIPEEWKGALYVNPGDGMNPDDGPWWTNERSDLYPHRVNHIELLPGVWHHDAPCSETDWHAPHHWLWGGTEYYCLGSAHITLGEDC